MSVGHPINPEPRSRGCMGERLAPVLLVPAAARRDRIPLRVPRRMTQHGVDPLLQPVAQDVLQQLGLGVDLVPRHVQHPHEERLQQPVPADDPDRNPLALRSEPQPGTLGPFQQVLALETLAIADTEGDDTPNA